MIIGLGHPRCGTGFTAALLQNAGLKVGHERMKRQGSVSWPLAASSETVPWGHALPDLKGAKIFCVARSPLKSIPSIIPENRAIRSFGWRAAVIREKLGVDIFSKRTCPQNKFGFAIASYIYWFDLIETHEPQMVFRVDRPEDDEKLATFLDCKIQRSDEIRRNSRPKIRADSLTLEDLSKLPKFLLEMLKDRAVAFGYDEDAEFIASASC